MYQFLIIAYLFTLNCNQSELQIGFSEGLSPGLGSLFLSEAAYDAHVRRVPLYIAKLDSQKAFALRKLLRVKSVIYVNLYYITVL